MRDGFMLDFRCIHWHRWNAGLSADALAALAGVSRGTVGHLETGRVRRGMRSVRAIADVLGLTPEELGQHPADADPPLELRAKREARGLTKGELAQQAGVTERIVARAEDGIAVHPSHGKALADFFGCRVTDFAFYPRSEIAEPVS